MPIALSKIEKLFPNENFEDIPDNVLMSKIKIPKNILSLSDKLPKPRYVSDMKENPAEQSLPLISTPGHIKQKKSKHSYLRESEEVKNKEGLEMPSLENSYLPRKAVPRQYKIPKKRSVRSNVSTNGQEESESIPTEQLQNKASLNGVASSKLQSHLAQIEEDSPVHSKLGGEPHLVPIDSKNNNKIRPVRVEIDSLKKKNPRLEALKEYEHYIHDSYIHQLVAKKNPLIKQVPSNLQRIMGIYSGANSQQALAIQKR